MPLKPTVPFHMLDTDTGWEPVPGGAPGVEQKMLSGALDEDSKIGVRNRLIRFQPGTVAPNVFLHDDWEEVYLIAGTLVNGCDARGARGSGTVVNIVGMDGRANRASYVSGSAANAALIAFTQAIGAETQAQGLRIFGINPSPTLTDRMTGVMRHKAQEHLGDPERWREMIEPRRFPFGRPALPAEIAALACLPASPRVGYLNGTVIDMDGRG